MFKNKRFVILSVLCIIFSMSSVFALDDLEGTAETVSGTTVYKAEVLSDQSFANVFGVKGNNTKYESHGLVEINGGTVTNSVFGARGIGSSDPVYASYNKVNSTNGTIGTVYGGYAYGGSHNAAVQSNEVKINGGNIFGYIYGGYADGSTISITGNTVELKNATVGKSVYGACAFNTSSWLSMLRNTVTVEDSTINGSVYGGYASGSATAANNNTVVIKGNSNIRGSVYGGYALSSNSDAKNNTVKIEGGTLKNHIYGGVGRNVTGNTVVVKGGDLSGADLYGYSDGRKAHSNNTLELWASEVSVKSACNFENYYFMVPDGVAGTDKYMLKTQTPVNLSGAKVAVAMQNGAVLNVGDKINLIDKAEGTPELASLEGMEVKGGTLLTSYDFDLEVTENGLAAFATSEGKALSLRTSAPEPAGKAIVETQSLLGSQIASVAMLEEASDLASGDALSEAKASLCSSEKEKMTTFISVGGGQNDYYTSSHIKSKEFEFNAGIAWKIENNGKDNLIGAFFESGNGHFSTFYGFDNGSVFGAGNAQYYGAGILLDIEIVENSGFNFQATGHAGGIYSDWSSNDFKEKISYDTGHFYLGTTAGASYKIKALEHLNCDVYGHFSWNYQAGEDVDINGEDLQFEALNFIKTRLGTKISYERNENFNAYVGVAWDREFNEKAKAKVNGYDVEVSGLTGNSLFLELGTSFKVHGNIDWLFNLSAYGYTGVRRGINGSLFLSLLF